jgi:hypothetical protein
MGIENTAGAHSSFWNHEVASATGAACDFCVKNDAIRANASQCGRWETLPKRVIASVLDCT